VNWRNVRPHARLKPPNKLTCSDYERGSLPAQGAFQLVMREEKVGLA